MTGNIENTHLAEIDTKTSLGSWTVSSPSDESLSGRRLNGLTNTYTRREFLRIAALTAGTAFVAGCEKSETPDKKEVNKHNLSNEEIYDIVKEYYPELQYLTEISGFKYDTENTVTVVIDGVGLFERYLDEEVFIGSILAYEEIARSQMIIQYELPQHGIQGLATQTKPRAERERIIFVAPSNYPNPWFASGNTSSAFTTRFLNNGDTLFTVIKTDLDSITGNPDDVEKSLHTELCQGLIGVDEIPGGGIRIAGMDPTFFAQEIMCNSLTFASTHASQGKAYREYYEFASTREIGPTTELMFPLFVFSEGVYNNHLKNNIRGRMLK